MDRLAAMEVFAKVAETGSFAAAADYIGVSAAMIGKHVRQLEDHLGVKLINRTTRRQSLTDAGKDFLERVRVVLAEVEAAEALAAESRARPRGELRINAPYTFGAYAVAPALHDYMADNPDVTVRLTLSDRLVDLVDEGYDCVFRVGPLADSSLIARKLRPFRYGACASPAYLAARGAPAAPGDLAGHDCLGFSGSAIETVWRFSGPEGEIAVPIRPHLSVNSGEALRRAALAGLGIIVQAEELTREDVAAGSLVRVLPDWEPSPRPMHLLFAPDRRLTPKLRSFIEFSARRFG